MQLAQALDVSVLVATRNRPDQIGPCVETLQRNSADYRELIVIDQSDDDRTERALASFPGSAKLRYVRTATRGLSKARNLAIELSEGAIVAFTDDDCRVPSDWVAQLKSVFRDEPTTGLIFGQVTIPEVTDGVAHGASFEPHVRHIEGAFPDVRLAWGIGANMAMRRSLIDRVGPFDIRLGAGARFPAGEEVDFAIRALAAGARITNAAEVTLHHLGVRRNAEASTLMRGYLFATGAVFTKHVRLGTPGAVKLMTDTVVMHVRNGAGNVFRGIRPTGVGQLIALARGAIASLNLGVDPTFKLYRAESPKP